MSLADEPSSIRVDSIMCDLLDTAYEAAIRDNRVAAHRPSDCSLLMRWPHRGVRSASWAHPAISPNAF